MREPIDLSSSLTNPDAGACWQRRARWHRRKLNFACWLADFLPLFLGAIIAAICGLLLARQLRAESAPLWISLAVLLVLAAAWAWRKARSRFFSTTDVIARMDAELGMFNRLSAAVAGAAAWPELPRKLRTGTRWSLPRTVLPAGAVVAVLISAGMLPALKPAGESAYVMAEPAAWEQVQNWLEQLEPESVIEEETIERLQEQLQALRDQPSEKWYSHSSLEAGDNLRRQLDQSLRALQRDLNKTGNFLDEMRQGNGSEKADQLQRLAEALKGLREGGLPLDSGLLKDLDSSKLQQLSSEQLQQLRDRLAQASGVCKACIGEDEFEGEGAAEQPGRGGINRGPGTAPLSLAQQETQLGTDRLEALSNPDLSRAAIGDTLSEATGEHEVDRKAYTGPAASGGAAAAGSGGETVWKETFLPSEREVLQRYFK